MNHNRFVAEEGCAAWVRRQERVYVLRDKVGHGDVTMLASKIADLAGCWCPDVAGVVLAAVCGVEMAHGCAAVAVGWDGQVRGAFAVAD